jgi:uncharacterized protein (DUF362 family)
MGVTAFDEVETGTVFTIGVVIIEDTTIGLDIAITYYLTIAPLVVGTIVGTTCAV